MALDHTIPEKSNKELEGFGRWAKPYLESFILGDLVEIWPAKKAASIRLIIDCTDAVYTDGKIIHLGLGMLRYSTDLMADAWYLVGHELQHLHSTRDRDWRAGLVKSEGALYSEMTFRVLGRRKYPNTPLDVVRIADQLRKAGLHITDHGVGKFAHSIVNILEDGRIEKIRHELHPGFTAHTVQFRVSEWEQNPIQDYGPDPDLTAREELNIVMSQLYYLATMGHWQKGFTLQFNGTSVGRNKTIFDRCNGLIPIVAKAVMSPTCKGCMLAAAEVAESLSDLFYEVAKEDDPMELIKAIMAQMIKSALEHDSSYKAADGSSEETGSGRPTESPFGESVLVIELDDEDFDKLKESAGENPSEPQNPSVVIVRKNHKKEEEEETGESSSAQSGGGSGSTGSEESGSSGESGGCNSEESGESGKSGKAGSKESGNSGNSESADSEGSGESGESGEASSTASGSSGDSGDSGDANSETSGESGDSGEAGTGEPNGSGESGEASKAASKAEKEAETLSELKKQAESKTAEAHSDSRRFKDMVDEFDAGPAVTKPIGGNSESVDYGDIEAEYEESGEATRLDIFPRSFTPSSMLPYPLQKRGRALKREIQKRIKREELPARTGLRSGSLDSERLTRLAIKQVDIFKGQKKTNKPKKPAVFILIDNSGSMYGDKFTQCMEAAAIAEEGFKDLCSLKIVAFDTTSRDVVRHRLIKDWDESGKANLCYNYSLHESPDGGNKDGFSIRVATKDTLARPEREKLLLVLSDGVPTDYVHGVHGGVQDTRRAVEDARKSGVSTVGIYFEEGDGKEMDSRSVEVFQRMYNPAAICVRPDEIEKHLIDVLTRFFFKK